jgi:hypothetical protein
MFLTCPDEVIRFIGGTFGSALAQPRVAAVLDERPVSFRVGVVDPDCVLYVDAVRREVRFTRADDAPSPMIAMHADTAIALCQGRLDVDAALASGQIVATDDVETLFGLSTALPAIYADLAQREGRVDLLAS